MYYRVHRFWFAQQTMKTIHLTQKVPQKYRRLVLSRAQMMTSGQCPPLSSSESTDCLWGAGLVHSHRASEASVWAKPASMWLQVRSDPIAQYLQDLSQPLRCSKNGSDLIATYMNTIIKVVIRICCWHNFVYFVANTWTKIEPVSSCPGSKTWEPIRAVWSWIQTCAVVEYHLSFTTSLTVLVQVVLWVMLVMLVD